MCEVELGDEAVSQVAGRVVAEGGFLDQGASSGGDVTALVVCLLEEGCGGGPVVLID